MSMRADARQVKAWNEEVKGRRLRPCACCGHEPADLEGGHVVRLRPDTASHYGEVRCAMCDAQQGFLPHPPREHTVAWARYYEAGEQRRATLEKQGVLL